MLVTGALHNLMPCPKTPAPGPGGRVAAGHRQQEPGVLADEYRLWCCWRGMSQTHLVVSPQDAPLGAHCALCMHW